MIKHGESKMSKWIIVAISCHDCNSLAAAVFDHEPTEEDKNMVITAIGGMYCVRLETLKVEENNEAKTTTYVED